MTVLVNLTPHTINLYPAEGDEVLVSIPSAGQARCTTQREQEGTLTVAGYVTPINRTRFGDVTGLPPYVATCGAETCRFEWILASGARCEHESRGHPALSSQPKPRHPRAASHWIPGASAGPGWIPE